MDKPISITLSRGEWNITRNQLINEYARWKAQDPRLAEKIINIIRTIDSTLEREIAP